MPGRLEDPGHRVFHGAGGPTLLATGVAYGERALAGGLAAVCVWRTDVGPAAHRQRVLPDACVEVVFSHDRPPLVYGPRTGWLDVHLDATRSYEGIRLRAGTARAVLGVDLVDITDRVVELTDLTGSPLDEVAGRAFRRILERCLTHRSDPVVSHAMTILRAQPSLEISDLARRAGIGERQLRRRFDREVGLTPSALRRSSRVEAALRVAVSEPDWSWATIAYELGFADQAHLSRDIARCTGRSPSQLRRGTRRIAVSGDLEAPA